MGRGLLLDADRIWKRAAAMSAQAVPKPEAGKVLTALRPTMADSPRRVAPMESEQLDLAAVGVLTAARIIARRAAPDGARGCSERRRAELAILDSDDPALVAGAIALLNECSACSLCPGVIMPRLQRLRDAARRTASPSPSAS